MISPAALTALAGLDNGAHYNTLHTVARELKSLGYAEDSWGQLGITEQGRRFLRRGKFEIAITSDEHVSDLSAHMMVIPPGMKIDRTPKTWWKNAVVDPMASPQHVLRSGEIVSVDGPMPVLIEAPPEPLPVATDRMQLMLRAAGVASGITGVWVDTKWLEEFVRALDADKDVAVRDKDGVAEEAGREEGREEGA